MGITKMKVFIALAFLAVAAASPSTRGLNLIKLAKTNCGPDETECPAGCCPEANWYCCSDNQYCAATPDDCPNGPMILRNLLKKKWPRPPVDLMKLNAQQDVVQKPTGTVAQITNIVLLLQMIVQMAQKFSKTFSRKRLPRLTVDPMKLNAQLDVAQKPTGTVVQITNTVLLPQMTAQMVPKFSKISLRKRLPRPTVDLMKLNAQLDVAQKPTGTVAQIINTVLLPQMIAQMAPKFSKTSSRKRLPRPTVDLMKLNAQLDVAQKPTGTVAQITNTVQLPQMTAQMVH